jgi:hypothetical protein
MDAAISSRIEVRIVVVERFDDGRWNSKERNCPLTGDSFGKERN